jgi:hypothetical protein
VIPQSPLGPLLSAQQLSGFCPETLVVCSKYQQDFEKFGIHLGDSKARGQVAQLLALNQHFPALFNATLVGGGWGGREAERERGTGNVRACVHSCVRACVRV